MIFAAAAACALQVFSPAGTPRSAPVRGPALVLSGAGLSGMSYPKVLAWIDAHVDRGANARGGNLLILSASGGKDYSDDFYRNSRLASVREITIPPCARRSEVDRAAAYVTDAQIVLFAGGDQANYVRWKGSRLIQAIRTLYRRGGIVGGGSAGLAIQGEYVYDSVAADRVLPDDENVDTKDAVRNPFEPAISFTTGFFDWPALRRSITDTHFARRDRFGRLAAFMARLGARYGVAVDEDAALLVEPDGRARLVQRAKEAGGYVPRGAYILSNGASVRLRPGVPLLYRVDVLHLTREGAAYDFRTHTGTGIKYTVVVDGARTPPYSRTPY
ncbi:MAG TPA: hypothetical protein VFA29_00090 [Candidatus Baltobacteraceae bacterium]|nr:hypothetical protein [Candidatus Baltobacteraceae bacterium]